MGLLDFLFGKKKSKVEERIYPDPVEEGLKSAVWVIKEAFDKVMAGVDISEEAKAQFFEAYLEAHQSGNPREEEKAAILHLSDSGWKWRELEKWQDIFLNKEDWPYMWLRYPEVYEEPDPIPETTEEALQYLTVVEMRKVLKDRNVKPNTAPKKREDFEKIIKESFSLKDILVNIEDRINSQRSLHYQRREEGKCKLLAHTLTMTAYSLRNYYQCKELMDFDSKYDLKVYDSGGTCKIEDEYARKFNGGELNTIPPFFPGDRTGLRCERKRE